NKINIEKFNQQQDNNKIMIIDEKINKAIYEVDMPIFILNKENRVVKYNKEYEKILKQNTEIRVGDIFYYIEKNFINSKECVEVIQNSEINEYESLKLYTTEEKVYRFTCLADTKDNEPIKICILNDITQTTSIQKKVRESEEKYRRLMDVLKDGVIIHDIDNINYINDAAINMLNLKSEKTCNTISILKNYIEKESIPSLMENIKFIYDNESQRITSKVKTKDGLHIELITTKININNKQMLLTITIDITSMEKALIELEDSRKSYKMLIQNLPEGIVVIDKKNKNYIYQNRAMIKILKKISMDSVSKIINNYISNETYGITKRYNFKNKEISSISLTIIDSKDESQLVGVIRCLDEEEKTKERLKELDSIKMQYEVKNEFITTISQNLKTPITTIATANNLLDSNKFKYNSRYINNYTKLIKRNCYRLQRLINNMNEIVEIEKGFYCLEYTNCDIVKFIKDIVDSTNSYLEDKGVKIELKTQINKKVMKIDTDKIERVILNLLSNAIKFSEQGSDIKVIMIESDEYINISVEDNGVGIHKDKLNYIFNKFAQIDKTLSRNTEGSGVGLSLVKRFVELHNGKIEVNSQEGKGSKFTVKLNNNKCKLKESIPAIKHRLDNEKLHIEFADIYF
ncbi:MAG: ATP-binding protein, partial [Paraclostridium sp.]